MLTIYRSNKAEWLATLLGQQLLLSPPEVFESVEIIVNTWPMSRWLKEELTIINGINALVKFPFPGTCLQNLIRTILQIEESDLTSWSTSKLCWNILQILPELIENNSCKILRDWINSQTSKEEEVGKNLWQLTNSIANICDNYILYRPELVSAWIRNDISIIKQFNASHPTLTWQPTLFQLLHKKINRDPFNLNVEKAISIIKGPEIKQVKLPKKLYIFGLSNLAPLQINLIQALSAEIDIQLYLITPCRDLWKRCKERRIRLGEAWETPHDKNWIIESPRLEATLGRMGAEFQQLLEGSGEYQLGEWKERELFALPINIARNTNRDETLLEQLQQDMLSTNGDINFNLKRQDNSITFIEAPGKNRQVEIIRDYILKLLSEDETLQARDILVMTPQISSFASSLISTFNNTSSNGIELPWVITDRSQEEKPGLIQFIINLIETSSTRLTATKVDSILSNPALQAQQKISQEEIDKLTDCLQSTGFTWGLDSAERQGDEEHSLRWCLERWLLGLTLPSIPGLAHNGLAPFSEGVTCSEVSKWWKLLANLYNHIKVLRESQTSDEWIKFIKTLIQDFFGDGGEWVWEIEIMFAILDKWRVDKGDCQLKVDNTVIKEILIKELNQNSGRFGHRSGKITISALKPMRAIPHRVIILMGLDDKIFPRKDNRSSFNLLDRERQLGDPRNNDQDKYVILEALISARQNLLVTWSSKNERTGEELEPATPIQQLLAELKNKISPEEYKRIVIKATSNPLDHKNFEDSTDNSPKSCNPRYLDARKWIDKDLKSVPFSLCLPLKWESDIIKKTSTISLEETKEWLCGPQDKWLKNNLIQTLDWQRKIEDADYTELSELDRYKLLNSRIKESKENESGLDHNDLLKLNPSYWGEMYAGQGVFPSKSLGLIEKELLERRWRNLLKIINSLGKCQPRAIELDKTEKNLIWSGNNLIIISIGYIKNSILMDAWLTHLQVCAQNIFPEKTVLISRKNHASCKDEFEISHEWVSLTQREAQSQIESLKLLAEQGEKDCWPIPPESGLAMAYDKRKGSNRSEESFRKKWEGGFRTKGERDRLGMQICFGRECQASVFLESKAFKDTFNKLYGPIFNLDR